MQPSEFWGLDICDWWVELDSRLEQAEALEEIAGSPKRTLKNGGGFSQEQWAKARKLHKEKMSHGRAKRA